MSGDKSDIFGPPGVCDKIHFRGVRGPILYTEKTTQLGKALMGKKTFSFGHCLSYVLFSTLFMMIGLRRASGICFASSQFS